VKAGGHRAVIWPASDNSPMTASSTRTYQGFIYLLKGIYIVISVGGRLEESRIRNVSTDFDVAA
jgi:hypothetical protein